MITTVVIKSVRACNLRCSYCYYINDQTQGYGRIVSEETMERLYAHVSDYLGEQQTFRFVWHGGEPLLLGRRRLQKLLDLQAAYFRPEQVQNSLQSNGVLIDQEWIDFFRRNRIGVGISIDSSREAHDKNRITTRGMGTYARVTEAIRLFHANHVPVGSLSVIDPEFDGEEALRQMEKLGVQLCDFLIPMTNNALQESAEAEGDRRYIDFTKVGEFLAGAFRRWGDQPTPKLSIRFFECVLRNAFGLESGLLDAGSPHISDFLVMEPDGALCLDPDFWQIDRYDLGRHYQLAFNVHDADFSLNSVEQQVTDFARSHHLTSLPDACQTCKVRSLCRGSHPASRFGSDGSFNHRSAYCEAMFALCEAVLDYIIKGGYTDKLYDEDLKHLLKQQILSAA